MEEIKKIWKIEEIEEEIKKVYLIKDPGIIRITLATVIANRISIGTSPIWLLILAGSSAGKTIMLNLISKCGKYIVPVDTLTTNTFASGFKRDEETSLLHKAKNGILVFKDFTTITTMNEEGLREIMGQLRAIYDGSFDKKTGNNADVSWKGKIGIIAGGTIEVQRKMRQFSQQGERFINYIIDVADSKMVAKRAMSNQETIKEKDEYLQTIIAEFVNQKVVEAVKNKKYEIGEDIIDEMIDVANFCTLSRSPVIMNKKDDRVVVFVPNREEPSRVAIMLRNLAVGLMALEEDTENLSELNASIIYKTAMDSIPAERRLALLVLAKYRESNTQSLAIKLNYPTDTVSGWLNQLNALKMVDKEVIGNKFVWKLKQEYKDVLCKYLGIETEDVPLKLSDDEEENAYTGQAQKDLDNFVDELHKPNEEIVKDLNDLGF